MKNIFKTISLLTIFILMFTLVGCKEPHEHKFVDKKCECGEVHDCSYIDGICECGYINQELRVEFINNNLKNSNYTSSNYNKKIEFSGVILLEENTSSEFNGATYNVTSTIKKLNDKGILEENTLTEESTEPTEISLELKAEYFSEFNINDKTVEGKILDSAAQTFIGTSATNIEIKVTLNNDLKVSNITLKYIDSETNFNVSISVSYNY